MTTNNLRILLVVDSLDVGGAERHVIDLATALAVRGHEVEIACSVLAGDGPGLSAGSIPVHALLNNGVRRRLSLSYARELRRLLAEKPPDLVHAHVFASAAASAAALATSPIPLVVTEHSEPRWQEAPARRIRRGYLRRAGHVIAASERIACGCRSEAGLCAEGLSLIPCAVSPPPIAFSSEPLPGTGWEGPVVGLVARLVPEKGGDILIQAAARLASSIPHLRFVVIGDGPERIALERLAGSFGLWDRFRFLGTRLDARSLMTHFDILAVPSRSEGSPLVVLEAMAAGVPVVATCVGGIPEQLAQGEAGLLVPPEDPDALAGAVLLLLQRPDLRHYFAVAGRRRAAGYSMTAMVEDILSVYRRCLERDRVKGVLKKAMPHSIEAS